MQILQPTPAATNRKSTVPKRLFVIIVATACCDIDSVAFDVIDQTVFLIDSSTEFTLQVAF